MTPEDARDIENQLAAVAHEEATRELVEIVSNVARTVIEVSDSVKALSDVTFPAVDTLGDLMKAVERLTARIDRLEGREQPKRPTRQEVLDRVEEARQTLDHLHHQAVKRGEYEIHLQGDELPMVITEYRQEYATPDRLAALGITL